MGNDLSIVPGDKRVVQTLLWALKPLLNLGRPMPLPMVTAFLAIALDEGKGVCAYARDAGAKRSVMSRYIHSIGDRARDGGPGLGLIRFEQDPKWANRQQIYLTAKGHAVAADVLRNLRRPQAMVA